MAIETAIVKAGAIPVTVQAMRQHPFVQKVQQYAFELLAYLTVQNLRNQFLVAIVGAIPVIVQGMRQNGSVLEIQEAGCRILCTNNLHNNDLVAKAGAISSIAQAMRRHPEVLEYGCHVRGELASNDLPSYQELKPFPLSFKACTNTHGNPKSKKMAVMP